MDCMLNRRIVSGGSSSGLEPATLTITSTDYTGDKYMAIAWTKPDGTIGWQNAQTEAFNFPITIDTVVNGGVSVTPDSFSGIPGWRNATGCTFTPVYQNSRYILVTNSVASIEVYNAD